jgi:hypothetical protein
MPKKTHAERVRDFNRFTDRLKERRGKVRPADSDTGGIPVFYNEQDQTGKPCATVTRDEARDLKSAGEGKFIARGKAFQLGRRGPAPARLSFRPSLSNDSDASISVNEMRANVGEPADTPGAEIPRHIVQRANQKIRAIGRRESGTFDSRAPLAFGASSWPIEGPGSSARQMEA